MAGEYRGIVGAFVSAFRRSDSHLLRAYVVASAVVGALSVVFLALGLVYWLGQPAPLGQRALLGVIAIFLLVPLFAPVLVAARRHRRGAGNRRADALLGLVGFGFFLAVYLAGVISAPALPETSGPLAPAIAALDALPRSYWVAPPVLSIASIWLAVRLTRPGVTSRSSDGPGDGGTVEEPRDGGPDDPREEAGDRAEG